MFSRTTPYATWKSPINAVDITKGANSTAVLLVDSSTSERRRNELVHTTSKRDIVGPGWNVRTGVQEYSGAMAIVRDGVAYFSHLDDGSVYRVEVGEKAPTPVDITPKGKPFRFAAFEVHPLHSELLLAVLEDHPKDVPSEIVNTLVVINLAWLQWNRPDMPWNGAEV
ncbi:hypothetical protein CPC08DRAFT_738028 [Agrocybe pediades]|nr:hypothetical protein CPC08DRAFT_738028 [Agrocybe pediades]